MGFLARRQATHNSHGKKLARAIRSPSPGIQSIRTVAKNIDRPMVASIDSVNESVSRIRQPELLENARENKKNAASSKGNETAVATSCRNPTGESKLPEGSMGKIPTTKIPNAAVLNSTAAAAPKRTAAPSRNECDPRHLKRPAASARFPAP